MNTEPKPTEIVSVNAIESISRAEIDVAIATARRFPRQLSTVKKNMLSFATLDQETAESCFYSLPRGGKNIQGPSVRLAEIAVSSYGNLRAGSRILETVTDGANPHVTVQAVAMDLENNIQVSIEKRRRIVGKKSKGGVIDEDDINLAANAGSAIAFRDAVFKIIPMALIKPVFEQAKKVAIGDAKTLTDRRARCVEAFAKMGVSKEKLIAKVGKKSVDDFNLEDVEMFLGLHNAIKDGEVQIDEAFPAVVKKPDFGGEPSDGDLGPQKPVEPKPEMHPKPHDTTKPQEAPAEPLPVETPKDAAATEPATPPAAPDATDVVKLRELLAANSVSEKQVFGYCKENKIWTELGEGDVPTTLEQIPAEKVKRMVALLSGKSAESLVKKFKGFEG